MAQEALTKAQLTDMISASVKDILKAEGLSGVVDTLNERIETAMAPLRQETTDWGKQIIGALNDGRKTALPAREKGLAFGRIVRAMAVAKREGGGAEKVIKVLEAWGDTDLAEAQTKALAASIAGDGGYLVAPQFSTDILEHRKAATVVRRAGPRELPMPTGTLHLPKIANGVTGAYIGENTNAPASQPVFGENILTWKKLAVVTPISNDLLRYNSPASDAVVRDDIVRSLAVTEDGELLRGQGVNGGPKGLRHWAAAANVSAALTASLANVTTDLGGMILDLLETNVPLTKGAWFFAPRTWYYLFTVRDGNGNYAFKPEMERGTLFMYPFYVTTSVPITLTVGANSDCSEITFANMDDAAIGDSERLLIDVSSEAAYHNGSAVVAAFSLDQTVIRAIAEHDFVVRDPNAVSIRTGVRWGT